MNAFMKQLKAELVNAIKVAKSLGYEVTPSGSYLSLSPAYHTKTICLLGTMQVVADSPTESYFTHYDRTALADDFGLTGHDLKSVEDGFCYDENAYSPLSDADKAFRALGRALRAGLGA